MTREQLIVKPEELKKGDKLSSGAYEIVEDAWLGTKTFNQDTVYCKVRWSDGGLAIREWDSDGDVYLEVYRGED